MKKLILSLFVFISFTANAQVANRLVRSYNTQVDTVSSGLVTVYANLNDGMPPFTYSVDKNLLKWNTSQIRGFNDSLSSKIESYNYIHTEQDPIWISDSIQYLRKVTASDLYQIKGNYITPNDTIGKWKPLNWNPDLSNYYTKVELDSLIPTKLSELDNDEDFISEEVDPTISAWAKEVSKPEYEWDEIVDKPSSFTPSSHIHPISEIINLQDSLSVKLNKSEISTVGFTGEYSDLLNQPGLFDGDYNSLTNKPTIPATTSQLTNDSGFLTGISSGQVITALGYTPYNDTNPNGYITSSSLTWSNVTGKPSFSTVATSGSYNDLSDKPTIPTNTNQLTNGSGFISDLSGFSTTNLSEGSNLYFTSSRVRSSISLTTTGTSGDATYNSSTGVLNIPNYTYTAKRQETYSGTTNSSGEYTVTFSTVYSQTPNIQAQFIGGTANQMILITSVSTTGFTVKVVQRNAVTILGIEVLLAATTNVNNANVNVLITEK